MSGLRSATDELAGEQLGVVDAADLAELSQQLHRLHAQLLRRLAAFDRQEGWRADGCVSGQSWLRTRLHMAPGAARQQLAVARRLENLPLTASAFADGTLSYAHARVIATAELAGETMAEAEAILVDAARDLNPVRLGQVVTHLRDAVHPDAAVDDAIAAHERRRLHVSTTWRGMVVLDGQLDPEGGETLLAALDAMARPDPPGQHRTPAQRNADALVDLARGWLDGGVLPDVGGERPHITVTVDLDTLQRRAGASAGQLDLAAAEQRRRGGSGARLSWGGIVCGETARRLACDAGITRVITAGPSQPLDVGRRSRTVPPAIRRALVVRDKGAMRTRQASHGSAALRRDGRPPHHALGRRRADQPGQPRPAVPRAPPRRPRRPPTPPQPHRRGPPATAYGMTRPGRIGPTARARQHGDD